MLKVFTGNHCRAVFNLVNIIWVYPVFSRFLFPLLQVPASENNIQEDDRKTEELITTTFEKKTVWLLIVSDIVSLKYGLECCVDKSLTVR